MAGKRASLSSVTKPSLTKTSLSQGINPSLITLTLYFLGWREETVALVAVVKCPSIKTEAASGWDETVIIPVPTILFSVGEILYPLARKIAKAAKTPIITKLTIVMMNLLDILY